MAYAGFTVFQKDSDLSLFLIIHGVYFACSAFFCFLAELRLEKLRYLLSPFGFLHTRQGRGWFTAFLGAMVLFFPLEEERPWISKTCGSLQLFAGLNLLLISYAGGLKDNLYTAERSTSGSSSSRDKVGAGGGSAEDKGVGKLGGWGEVEDWETSTLSVRRGATATVMNPIPHVDPRDAWREQEQEGKFEAGGGGGGGGIGGGDETLPPGSVGPPIPPRTNINPFLGDK